ncbi:MAG: DUF2723 domain-containing protein [Bacteroidales bacterium]|jgi:hypothetical protein|nr:DUF2723 domain-containing protein [Bacteroidales bacterium]
MEKNYCRLNNIIGWLIFAIAAFVYLSTMQRTVSWWDCGEFISTTYKLEVPHPPGNPTFQLIGRIFTLFAFGDATKVAMMINTMSALCSAFTILFLFWSITLLGRKIVEKNGVITESNSWMIFGAGIIGALIYTFTDTFWFSAVEGEVYAMSSFFTAFVFWAILRWDREADQPNSSRWLILSTFLIGLAIGAHLLNILTVPTMAYVVYYRKFNRRDWKGWFLTGVISLILVAFIMYIVIPWTVQLAGYFELFFVNILRLPFNIGTIVYFILLIGGIVFGIWYTQKKGKALANTIMLCFAFLLIGYSSFFSIVIRANETLPINMNEPKDALSMVSYLNRDQYGTRPLIYGEYYNSPIRIDYQKLDYAKKDGAPIYYKNKETKRYDMIARGNPQYEYEPDFCTVFPRMYSGHYPGQEMHVEAYKEWGKIKGRSISYNDPVEGQRRIVKPTFGENLRFFFRYQINHMYWRYFMWNFSGRQNDTQGHGSPFDGNWITGFDGLDKGKVGTQRDLPDSMKSTSNNKYYLLPFILGLIGLFYHIHTDKRNSWVVFLLFFMTGLAIIIYLNQAPYQPRERDYAYAGSFYAFCIWIGFSVMCIASYLAKYVKEKPAALITTIVLLGVPILMAQQNWDDHNRSKNHAAHDYGANYLMSCPPNAILFTNGDNDTYPLWYAQEVEGIRTDVRVINYQLSAGAWYANQMAHKINNSEKLPLTLSTDQYRHGDYDQIFLSNRPNLPPVLLKEGIDFIANPKNQKMLLSQGIPTKKFLLPVDRDKILRSGLISEEEYIKSEHVIPLTIPDSKNGLFKHELLFLDFLSTNDWERPICFTSPGIIANLVPLAPYFHLVGSVYQLLPYKGDSYSIFGNLGNVRIDSAYQFFMEEFKSGDLEKSGVEIDAESKFAIRFPKQQLAILADALQNNKDTVRTLKVVDKYLELFPLDRISSFSSNDAYMGKACLDVGDREKGEKLIVDVFNQQKGEIDYITRQRNWGTNAKQTALYDRLYVVFMINNIARNYDLIDLQIEIEGILNQHPWFINRLMRGE